MQIHGDSFPPLYCIVLLHSSQLAELLVKSKIKTNSISVTAEIILPSATLIFFKACPSREVGYQNYFPILQWKTQHQN